MAQQRPQGADGNALSWTHIFGRSEGSRHRAKLSRTGASDLYKEKSEVINAIGQSPYDKMVKARYDWLFDDLQQFTSISAESIESKQDLRDFVEQTIGESKGFLSMKESNPRRYNTSINRATDSLWRKGMVEDVARTNVVEVVSPTRAKSFVSRVKSDRGRKIFTEASNKQELFRLRREQFAIRRVDRRGRRYFYDPVTGRRVINPKKLLRELGFE
jgi:hypothetical protein